MNTDDNERIRHHLEASLDLLRNAMVSEPPAPDSEGWIPWAGGECPVPQGDSVDYKLKNGAQFSRVLAVALDWRATAPNYSIVAYRPAKPDSPQVEPWTPPVPPRGMSWHRDDWQESMLPREWRPLLRGETRQTGDEVYSDKHSTWLAWPEAKTLDPVIQLDVPGETSNLSRTRRPLPLPERLPDVRLPLRVEDVPPGSAVSHPKWGEPADEWWRMIEQVSPKGIHFGSSALYTFEELHELGWLIKKPGEAWQPASRAEKGEKW